MVELDLEKEKLLWLDNIKKFYKLAKQSLEKYIDNGTVTFRYIDRTLTEELFSFQAILFVLYTLVCQDFSMANFRIKHEISFCSLSPMSLFSSEGRNDFVSIFTSKYNFNN